MTEENAVEDIVAIVGYQTRRWYGLKKIENLTLSKRASRYDIIQFFQLFFERHPSIIGIRIEGESGWVQMITRPGVKFIPGKE